MADYDEVQGYQHLMGKETDTTHPSFTNSAAKGDSERKDQSRYGDDVPSIGLNSNTASAFVTRPSAKRIGPRDPGRWPSGDSE